MLPSRLRSVTSTELWLCYSIQAAEKRTAQAVADNAAIADEVDAMRTALERLQNEQEKAARSPALDVSPRKSSPSPLKVTAACNVSFSEWRGLLELRLRASLW